MATSSVGLTSSTGLVLPITSTFAAPFTAYFILLSGRVAACRLRDRIVLGHKADPPTPSSPSPAFNPLFIATRCHANFAENVPLALILAAAVELNGGSRRVLAGCLGGLFLLRVLHVEMGLRREGNVGWGRIVGYYGTMGMLAGLGLWAGALGWGGW